MVISPFINLLILIPRSQFSACLTDCYFSSVWIIHISTSQHHVNHKCSKLILQNISPRDVCKCLFPDNLLSLQLWSTFCNFMRVLLTLGTGGFFWNLLARLHFNLWLSQEPQPTTPTWHHFWTDPQKKLFAQFNNPFHWIFKLYSFAPSFLTFQDFFGQTFSFFDLSNCNVNQMEISISVKCKFPPKKSFFAPHFLK